VDGFASKRISTVDHICRNFGSPRTQLERELPMIRDLTTREIVGKKVEWELLVPRGFHGNHFRVGFVAIEQQLDFASAIPREVKRGRSVSEILAIDFHERALGVGVDRYATMHAAGEQAAE
jgi:hypothetical protein